MTRNRLGWVMLFLALLSIAWVTVSSGRTRALEAEWTPVVAKTKQRMYRSQSTGTDVQIREKHGNYWRSSEGSVMQTWATPDGKEAMSLFIDSKTGNTYKIFHDLKRFQIVQHRPVPLVPRRLNPHSEAIVGREFVNGINCVGFAAKANLGTTVGMSWVSLDDDLQVKADVRLGETRVIDEIYDIERMEPDPGVFKLPEGYLPQ